MNFDPNQQQAPYQPSYIPPRRTNTKSITALVLGILSLVVPYVGFIIGIVAIIISRVAAKEIKQRGEDGSGMALAGLICGIVGTAFYAIIIIILVIGFFALQSYTDIYNTF